MQWYVRTIPVIRVGFIVSGDSELHELSIQGWVDVLCENERNDTSIFYSNNIHKRRYHNVRLCV